jgi:hypothetical protein
MVAVAGTKALPKALPEAPDPVFQSLLERRGANPAVPFDRSTLPAVMIAKKSAQRAASAKSAQRAASLQRTAPLVVQTDTAHRGLSPALGPGACRLAVVGAMLEKKRWRAQASHTPDDDEHALGRFWNRSGKQI